MFFAAGTLLVPSGTSHDPGRKHLHIVCNDTDTDGFNLLVPVTTWTNDRCDNTCILLQHEHTWLTNPRSYVFYRKAEKFEAAQLLRGINAGNVAMRDDCNGQTFLRVKNGVCRSPQTPSKIKRYFGCLAG